MERMNPEMKVAWTAKLRSGEIRQARGILQEADGSMCCLGVLCEISGVGKWVDDSDDDWEEEETFFAYEVGDYRKSAQPPKPVLDAAGLSGTPAVFYNHAKVGLWYLNDHYRLTFEEIADLIDEQL